MGWGKEKRRRIRGLEKGCKSKKIQGEIYKKNYEKEEEQDKIMLTKKRKRLQREVKNMQIKRRANKKRKMKEREKGKRE